MSISESIFLSNGPGHKKASTFKNIFPKKHFNKYFKFTFARNPYDRLHSAYNFLKTGGMNDIDKEFFKHELDKYSNFEDFVLNWVNEKNCRKYYHFIPQYEFICDNKLNVLVDFIGKFENIEEDFNYVVKKIEANIQLKHLNKTKIKDNDFNSIYNFKMKEIVWRVYKNDFNVLGYDR